MKKGPFLAFWVLYCRCTPWITERDSKLTISPLHSVVGEGIILFYLNEFNLVSVFSIWLLFNFIVPFQLLLSELIYWGHNSKFWYTHAIISFPRSFLAVNHLNIKNWVPSILTHILWLIFMGMKQKKKFEKKIPNGLLKHRQKLSNFRFMDWSMG